MWMIIKILLIIGGLNWGLVGLGGFLGKNLNLVNFLLGKWPQVEWIIYLLVGIAALTKLVLCFGKCKECTCK